MFLCNYFNIEEILCKSKYQLLRRIGNPMFLYNNFISEESLCKPNHKLLRKWKPIFLCNNFISEDTLRKEKQLLKKFKVHVSMQQFLFLKRP